MQELVFWLIIVPLMAVLACVGMLREQQKSYKRLRAKRAEVMGMVPPRLLPTWKSGTVPDMPQSVTSGVTDEMIASNNAAILAAGLKLVVHGYLTEEQLKCDLASVDIVLPVPSSGYTPLLDDDPYQASEESEIPAPQIDPKLIGKEYR